MVRFWARTRGRKHFKTRSAKWRILSKRFHSLLCSCHIFSKVSLQIKPKPISSLSIQNTQLFGNQWPLGKIETKNFKRDRSIIVEECHLLLVTTRITKKFQRLHRVLTIPLAASPFTDKLIVRPSCKDHWQRIPNILRRKLWENEFFFTNPGMFPRVTALICCGCIKSPV